MAKRIVRKGKVYEQYEMSLPAPPVLVKEEKPKLTAEDRIHQDEVLRWALGQDSFKVAWRRDQLIHDATYGPERG